VRRQAAVGWLCLCTLVLTFAAYAAMALGGTELVGTLYEAERLTAQISGVLSVLLALLLIAASSGAERVLRGVCLGLAAVALATPAVYVAAQDVEPAVSDTITCGSVTSPQIHSTPLERSSCEDALLTQKAFTAILALVPVAVAIASVVVLARRTRPNDG
jgi:hypothetical protein